MSSGSPARKLGGDYNAPRRTTEQHRESLKPVKKKLSLLSPRLGLDMPFLFLIIALLAIGLVMMFSASYPAAYQFEGNSYYYLIRQSVFLFFGFIIMMLFSYVDYHHLHKVAFPLLVISFLLLAIVLLIPSSTGVHRWLPLGLFSIQASEVSKFAIILFLAHWGSIHFSKMDTFKIGVLPAAIILAVTDLLLIMEPHFSGAVIITALVAIMMYLSGVKLRWFAVAGAAIVLVILLLSVTGTLGYAVDRLGGWGQALEYTDSKSWNATYQTRNSLYAIGSGGFWGLGLGNSRQKHLYLPEAQNDFVFAIVCEELGFVGALVILLIFALLIWRGITISMRAKDKFGTLLGVGFTAQIGLQVVLNILVITDMLPNTGISLPFFSYGGSSLMMLLMQMGIVMSVSRTANIEKA